MTTRLVGVQVEYGARDYKNARGDIRRERNTLGFAYSCSESANYFRSVCMRACKIVFINPADAFHLHNLKHNTNMNEHGEKRNK